MAAVAVAGLAGAAPQPNPTRPVASAASRRADAVRLHGLMRIGDRAVALLEIGGGRPRRLQPGETAAGWTLLRVESARVFLESPAGEPVEVGLAEPSAAPAERSSTDAARAGEGAASAPAEPPSGQATNGGHDAGAADAMPADAMEVEAMAAAGMMEPGPAPPVSSAPAVPSASRRPAASAGGERRFSRDEIRLRLATELPRILTGATVVPRIDGNEVVGLELVSFPTDTILGETGLLPNDVLLRVNDREVRGVESLAVLVQRFQTASRIELAVERGGEVVSLRYAIE